MQRSFRAVRQAMAQTIARGRALPTQALRLLLQLMRPALALVALTLVLAAMLLQLMPLATARLALSTGGFASRATTRSS